MFKLISSLFKYILWLAVIVLLTGYTQDRTFVEKCAMTAAAIIIIDAVFLLIEVIYNAVRSTKRANARRRQRSHERSLVRAEKRGARKARREAKETRQTKEKQPEPGVLDRLGEKLGTLISKPDNEA